MTTSESQQLSAWLTPAEVASYYCIPKGTLQQMRSVRKNRRTGDPGPPYIDRGRRILYRRSDIEAWLDTKKIR